MLVSINLLLAQAPAIAWQKRIGGTKNELPRCKIQKTNDGGFIFGGDSASDANNEKTENCRGGSDYWIVKTDSSGNIEWDKTIGGAQLNGFPSYEDDFLKSVFQTTDGGYLLCGDSNSPVSADKTEACRGYADIWVVKLSSTRAIEWQRAIGGSFFDHFSIAINTQDGGYLIHCVSPSSISGEKTEDSRGDYDIWLVKLSSTGLIEWQKTIGGSGRDGVDNIIQNPDGTYVLAGSSSSNISGEKSENSHGNSDIWLLKLDNIGNILYQKTIGGSGAEGTRNIIATNDGNYFISATSDSPISGDKTDSCRGGNDI